MSKQLTEKIKLMNAHLNPATNASTMVRVGANMEADANTAVAAEGTVVAGGGEASNNAITDDTNAHNLALASTIAKAEVNKNSVERFNAGAVIVQQQYPNNPTKWTALGFETTESVALDAHEPEAVLHGSFSVGDYLATMSIHFDPAVGTGKITYTAQITNGDPSDASKYIQVESPEISYTKTTFTINLTPEYLDVNVWIKITAHNTAGASPASVPFGGRKIPSS